MDDNIKKGIKIALDEGEKLFLHVNRTKTGGLKAGFSTINLPNGEGKSAIANMRANAISVVNDEENSITVYFGGKDRIKVYSDWSVDLSEYRKLNKIQFSNLIYKRNVSLSEIYGNVENQKVFKPTADFHTHLETALSTANLLKISLLDAILSNKGRKINIDIFEKLGFDTELIPEAIYKNFLNLDILKEKYSDIYEKLMEFNEPTYWSVATLKNVFDGIIDFETDERFKKVDVDGREVSVFKRIQGKRSEIDVIEVSTLLPKLKMAERIVLDAALAFKSHKQEQFKELSDKIYARQDLNGNLEKILKAIACEYKNQGVDYVELSTARLLNGDKSVWETIDRCVPEIEKVFGVKLRFLASFERSEENKWNEKMERFKSFYESSESLGQEYIVGFDIAGYESSKFNNALLKMLLNYLVENKSKLTMRLHAGENSYPHENVYNALAFLKNELNEFYKSEEQYDVPKDERYMPRIRIGHGVFFNDYDEEKGKQTIRLVKEMGAAIEINMSSNFLLNNINAANENPVKKYLDEGVMIVIGTDGPRYV